LRRKADPVRGRVGLQVATEIEAASAWHVNVEDDDVGAMPSDCLGRGKRIVGLFELDVDCLERRPQQRPQARIVVKQQDAHRARNPPIRQ